MQIEMAHRAGYTAVVSHRSGETEDTRLPMLWFGTNAGQIKTGSACRTRSNLQIYQLIRIEEELGEAAKFAGKSIVKKSN